MYPKQSMLFILVLMVTLSVFRTNCHNPKAIRWRKTFINSTVGFTQELRLPLLTKMILCSTFASRFDWASLVYEEGGSCVVTDKQFQIVQEKDSTNAIPCMTRLSEGSCVLPNGTIINDGDEAKPYCGNMRCERGSLINLDIATIEPQSTCPPSFTIVNGLGCVKTHTIQMNWCDARQRCMSEGADLVQLDSYTDVSPLQNYFQAQGITDEVWIGLYKLSGVDYFTSTIDNQQIHKDNITIWTPTDPNDGPGWHCIRSTPIYESRIRDIDCLPLFYFMCEVPLL